ncbi:hypothetical protein GGS24DRAFT_464146 [Hypoxylon argillaceum]|nr:hypothetical protein GGS24DRAFT_464146 [Hypoxylon argillaceum]
MANFVADGYSVSVPSAEALNMPSNSSSISPAARSTPNNTSVDGYGDLGYFEHSLAKKGTFIQVFRKVLEIDTGIRMDKSKTLGTISVKNGGTILMAAHSGYSTGQKREEGCLETKKWNYLALHHLAKQINFKFPGSIRDAAGGAILDEHRGRAHAGHVEVLLACWYVVQLVREAFHLNNKPETWLITQLKRLKGANLGDRRVVFINIDSEPCRVCTSFLNRVSQYTGILFMVSGSNGIGPIHVRVDGKRREDVVAEVFTDSEYGEEDMQSEAAADLCDVVTEDPTPPKPTTPARQPILRRPGSYWREKPLPWTSDDPQELLASYKKKTPVYEFPGYDRVSRPNSMPLDIGPNWDIDSPSNRRLVAKSRHASISRIEENADEASKFTKEDGLNEWEDLGDGLMVCFPNAARKDQDHDPVKHEQTPLSESSPEHPPHHPPDHPSADSGQAYARAAYEALRETIEVEEVGYEVIERRHQKGRSSRQLHRRNREPTRMLPRARLQNIQHRAANGWQGRSLPKLQEFRHHARSIDNESVLKNRYSILRPCRRH